MPRIYVGFDRLGNIRYLDQVIGLSGYVVNDECEFFTFRRKECGLTQDNAIEIRQQNKLGVSIAQLARDYNVSTTPIACIVKSDGSDDWLKMTPHPNNTGRLCILFKKDNKNHYQDLIYRIMLAAFVGPCPPKMEACHDDGDFNNNKLSNVYWGTHSHNEQCKRKHGTYYDRFCKLKPDDLGEIKRLSKDGMPGAQIAKLYGVNDQTIYNILNGKSWKRFL